MSERREHRKEGRPIPDWLKYITSLPACTHCGVVVGACLLEVMGVDKSVCPKEKLPPPPEGESDSQHT